jgi:protein ImuB
VAALLDRLTAKLGPDKVTWAAWVQSHRPERVEGRMPALAGVAEPAPEILRERPLRLFDPPEEVVVIYAVPEGPPARLSWRRVALRVVRFEGPERIAPEWWRDRSGTRLRDYYKVEVTDGRRLWLFREGIVGDARGGAPRWFVQGIFG